MTSKYCGKRTENLCDWAQIALKIQSLHRLHVAYLMATALLNFEQRLHTLAFLAGLQYGRAIRHTISFSHRNIA